MAPSFTRYFSRFRGAEPRRLHFAAHSHHPWPDVTFEAQQEAWLDAARWQDEKWTRVFETLIPQAQAHVAKELALPEPRTLAFAPNTHELVQRLLSCLGPRPRIVTTDGEFHSLERQLARLEEEGLARVVRVPTEPFDTFRERLVETARRARPDLVACSHVFFDSGFVVPKLDEVVAALPSSSLVLVDGYHGFCAVPTDLSRLGQRAFYVAGGYKYAMAGEGACFLHVPPTLALRPRDTGWFAAFGALAERNTGRVPYAPFGGAFLGATFDVTPLYRLDAVMRWRRRARLTTAKTRAHAHRLQERFVRGLGTAGVRAVSPTELVVALENPQRGQFLTFRTPRAAQLVSALAKQHVVVDARGDRLRFGFGVAQDERDVDALVERLATVR